jgi:hypothetical protein
MTRDELTQVLEALKGCWSEIEGMEGTYDDYVVAGDLAEQVEEAIAILEAHLV